MIDRGVDLGQGRGRRRVWSITDLSAAEAILSASVSGGGERGTGTEEAESHPLPAGNIWLPPVSFKRDAVAPSSSNSTDLESASSLSSSDPVIHNVAPVRVLV